MTDPRVVSLLASATEIVCALGHKEALVGRSHECDYPPSVAALPACTASKIDTRGTSRDIDGQVKSIVEQGLSVYRVDGALLRDLRSDVIVTQTQCEVYAASPKDLEQALVGWTGSEPEIVSLEPNALDDIWSDIRAVAQALGHAKAGDRLVAETEVRMATIEAAAVDLPTRPIVACIEWIDPLMAAGGDGRWARRSRGGRQPLGIGHLGRSDGR